jgi:hypothetical protein
MERHCVRRCDRQVDSPADCERPDERHDREHGKHCQAQLRRRHVAGGAVVILIEEAKASCEGEQRGGDHQAANPPDGSPLPALHGTHLELHLCMSTANPAFSGSPRNIPNSRGSLDQPTPCPVPRWGTSATAGAHAPRSTPASPSNTGRRRFRVRPVSGPGRSPAATASSTSSWMPRRSERSSRPPLTRAALARRVWAVQRRCTARSSRYFCVCVYPLLFMQSV